MKTGRLCRGVSLYRVVTFNVPLGDWSMFVLRVPALPGCHQFPYSGVTRPPSTHSLMHTYARVSLCNVSMYVLLSVVLTALSSVTRTNANTHARFSKDTCRCSIAANYRVYVKKHVSYNWFNTHRIRTQARHTLMCMRGHVAWPYIALMSQCCTSF